MMDKSNPMDWVFVLCLVQVVGLKYLMTATDGEHFGFVRIQTAKRWFALIIGMMIIWIPYLLVWKYYGHSPLDMWDGATEWWSKGYGFPGKAIAIMGWWLLASPVQAVLAAILTLRVEVRDLRNEMALVLSCDSIPYE